MTQNGIIDEFLTFVFVGSETVTSLTRTMIFRMIEYPEVMQKVRLEIQEHIGNEEITFDKLKKLKYLDCVQKEVLRM